MKKILLAAMLLWSSQGCYYDKEEIIYPEGDVSITGCDSLQATYALSVKPLIERHCLICHGSTVNASMGGGENLEGYANISGKSALLLKTIRHDPGVSPMPMNASKLSDCDIRKVEQWINAGASNN